MSRGELFFRGGVLLFFLALIPSALGLRMVRRAGEVGSGLWPLVILGLAAILALILLIQALLPRRSTETLPAPPEGVAPSPRRALLAAASTLAYLVAMPWVGFFPSSIVFLPALMRGLGERRVKVLALGSVLVVLGVYLVFVRFIGIALPRGTGVFLTVSRALY